MKILHVVPSYKPAYIYGGPIESVSKLCEGLAQRGHDVDVFTTTANGASELDVRSGKVVDVEGVKVIYFRRITKDPTHISIALWKYLYVNARKYDVIHIHSWWSILVIVSLFICLIRGSKVVLSPRGMLSAYIFNSGRSVIKNIIHKTVGKPLLKRTWFHATAKSENDECKAIIPGWNGFTIPNVISLPAVPVIKVRNDVFTIIFMSRIHPKKGLELLFKAISTMDFKVKLKLAGTGKDEYIDKLKGLAVDLGIQDQIEWLGWVGRDDKFKLLMSSDLFALVSYNENFANVVIEALHVGTPVLVSYGVALSEFVTSSDMGWVTSLDVESVSNRISEIQNDEVKRSHINRFGNSVIGEQFSSHTLISSYLSHYQQIINLKAS